MKKFIALFLIAVLCVSACGCVNTATIPMDDTIIVTIEDKGIKRYDDEDVYLIYTEDETFKITDTLLLGKFNSSDIYGKLKVGHTYEVKMHGVRMSLFSEYRNIDEIIKEIKND